MVFKVLDKHDDNDPTSISEGKRITDDVVANDASRKIKIGIPAEFQLDNLNPDIKKHWIGLLSKLMESKLVEVYPVSIPSIKSSLPTYYTLVTSEASSNLSRYDGIRYGFRSDKYTETQPEFTFTRDMGFSEEVKRRITLGTFSLSSYGYKNNFIKATKLRSQLIDEFNRVFNDAHPLIPAKNEEVNGVDFIICPSSFDLPPLTSDYYKVKPIDSYLNDVLTIPSSLAGLPTVNVPYGEKSMGFQIIGQNGYDYKVLQFCNKVLECVN
ncbi:unnamed protein product [Ambrosiozyma monospora]|uniref:Unnamed protein product n=1 Tax=Ambrosiozyma monospora TaxID=43982 RepID=A0ACB5U1J6_AMBMO|nr:unnamed protein product [Ambrosiozyma monospora]